jgi:hypothetical protein
MASFQIAFAQRLDGVVVLQTFVESGIQVMDSVTVFGAPSGMSGTATVISTEPYEFLGVNDEGELQFDYSEIRQFQFLYLDAGDTYEREAVTGATVEFTPSVSWIASADVVAWLGIESATANDTAFIATCVSAANFWCWNKRREGGYTDSQVTVPNNSVKLGTVMYAATLYRERGTSGDSYGSYDGFSNQPQPVTLARIMQLLGCGRAQVA